MSKAKSTHANTAETVTPKLRNAKFAAKRPAELVEVIIEKSTKKDKQVAPVASASSKQQTLIVLLKRPKGASLEELMEATGWQRHSVHGTLSGVLKKRLGLSIITELGERGRMYRIVA